MKPSLWDTLRELSNNATPGPWMDRFSYDAGGLRFHNLDRRGEDGQMAGLLGNGIRQRDAAFIVAAVNYVRAALAAAGTEPTREQIEALNNHGINLDYASGFEACRRDVLTLFRAKEPS